MHLDPSYHVTEDRTKVCLSSKGYPASDPGDFGDFFCDSPYQLILSAFDFMKQQPQETDFIIWTGCVLSRVTETFDTVKLCYIHCICLPYQIEQLVALWFRSASDRMVSGSNPRVSGMILPLGPRVRPLTPG